MTTAPLPEASRPAQVDEVEEPVGEGEEQGQVEESKMGAQEFGDRADPVGPVDSADPMGPSDSSDPSHPAAVPIAAPEMIPALASPAKNNGESGGVSAGEEGLGLGLGLGVEVKAEEAVSVSVSAAQSPVKQGEAEATPQVADLADRSADPTPAPLEAGPSKSANAASADAAPSAAARRQYNRKTKVKEGLVQYTTAFVPGLYNIKNPAGDFAQRESNVEVVRQLSQARVKAEKAAAEEERARRAEAGEVATDQVNPLSNILIIHPGSRNLRFGRASDFYPKEIPNCIARPANAPHRGSDPPVPGSRIKRLAQEDAERREAKRRKAEQGEDGMDEDVAVDAEEEEDEGPWVDPVDKNIGYLRDYLRNKLRANRLATDYKEGSRVKASNARVKPEAIPEHNDPYRIDWTELDNQQYFIGTDALRLPESSGFRVRWPILQRGLNSRDWKSPQLLMDDIAIILQDSLRTELGILPKDYSRFSVVFIVPDHGDRVYVQEMTNLFLSVMGFKEIAVHQEAYAAIFSAGMSSACVVDIGAQQTSVTCVDEGMVNPDTRIQLNYGGDDITAALVALLQRSSFPYKELDLSRPQEALMMDNLKIKICTLEEHLVASTPWDFYVLKTEGLTQKYMLRTYDENILAPLCFFDTRLIDFEEKKGSGRYEFRGQSADVTDTLLTPYDEPTGAMKAVTSHLFPAPPAPVSADPTPAPNGEGTPANGGTPTKSEPTESQAQAQANGTPAPTGPASLVPASAATPAVAVNGETQTPGTPIIIPPSEAATPAPEVAAPASVAADEPAAPEYDIVYEASKSPLDAAIAASISMAGTENKVKAAANSILLIGGSSALKGLGAFIAERLPSLLRAKNLPISDVQIVPPPRNLNPRFVSWKGASVICNLESLSDMWIRKDEWEAIGARALKDRCLFL